MTAIGVNDIVEVVMVPFGNAYVGRTLPLLLRPPRLLPLLLPYCSHYY